MPISRTARIIHSQPSVTVAPSVGTKAFAESFIRGELSTYGQASQLATWLIEQDNEKTAASIGKACQRHLSGHGLMPASPGYQSLRKDKQQGGMILAAARCCQAVEQAAKRALFVAEVKATDNKATDNKPTDNKSTDKPIVQLDEKGKARTALGDIKASGITGKAELARIFSELQQACIEENLDKISTLILEGQKILAIAK